MDLKELVAAEMKLKDVMTTEVILMAIVLITVIAATVIIIAKMKPLKDFSSIKLGKLELARGKTEVERDKQHDEALNVIMSKLEGVSGHLGKMDQRLDGMDKRQDALYEFTREAVIYGTKGMVWSDQGAPYPEVVEAGLKAIMLGQDGNIADRMKTVISGQTGGLKLFKSELAKFEKTHKGKLDDRFYNAITEITYGMK